MSSPATTVPHRGVTTVLTLVVPLLILAASILVVVAWLDELPAEVATHWGTDGVDAVGPASTMLATFGFIGSFVTVGLWALACFAGQAAMTRRFATGTAVWLAVFLGGLLVVTFDAQRGLADARDAGDIGGGVVAVLGVAFAAGIAAGCLVPRDPARPATGALPATTPTIPLDGDARAVWTRTVRQSTGWVVGLVAVVLASAVALGAGTEWWAGLILAVGLAPLFTLLRADVVVDRRGLTARTALPWPRLHVALDEVEDVAVVQVDPFGQFGGWGLRTGVDGSVGMVLRKGEGIEVRATGGRRVVVTVDDATTGAALLATLAGRGR